MNAGPESRIKAFAQKLLDIAESLGEKAAYVAIWGIVALVFGQVLFRYLLEVGLPWPDEMARYFHIVAVFLCLGGLTREDRHVRIDLFRKKFRDKPADRIFVLIQLITSVVLVAGAVDIVVRIGTLRTPAAHMPLALFFLPAILGFALVAIESARKLLRSPSSDEKSVEAGAP